MPKPRELRVVGDHAVADELLKANRQRRQAGDTRRLGKTCATYHDEHVPESSIEIPQGRRPFADAS
ncbi:MAG: hypothetical protein IT428_24555 [Planctomycetaceae bacterium]|nr:hypothetical protein [Planctomycetaceae bacterium]